MSLQVEAGDLERGVDGVDGGRHVEHAAEAGARSAGLLAEHVDHEPAKAARSNGSMPGDRRGHGCQPREVRLVGVRLTQPEQAGVGVDLDDRAERPRLVHADDVEQRRVTEGDRGDDDPGDPGRLIGRA